MAVIIILIISACQKNVQQTTSPENNIGSIRKPQILQMPADSLASVYDNLRNVKIVKQFYLTRGYQAAWIENDGVSYLGDSMIFFIKNVNYYGLKREDYHYHEILPEQNLQRIDALLTDAFFAISKDLKYGKLSLQVIPGNDSLLVSTLADVIGGCNLKQSLELQEPKFADYQSLKKSLKDLLDTINNQEITSDLFDPSLLTKIQILKINLDRWRMETKPFGERYILINIPSFELKVVSNNSIVLTSKVIVGKPETPTPLLSSEIECFIIYPYWHVPRKIAVEEYLPVIKKDISFLRKGNFDVLGRGGTILNPDSVVWNKFSKNNFPVILRQREGPDNSLGLLKFVFENPYAVYLHDTNAKRLFMRDRRAFSHGCIRVESALTLAHYLTTGDVYKRSAIVTRYLSKKQRHTVDLKNPIPIYVRYFTGEVKDHVFYQYDDLYGIDKKLMEVFYQ